MRTILVFTAKGGSSKTTISRELAVASALEGRRVAMVDMDPQGSLTNWYGRRAADAPALIKLPASLKLAPSVASGFDDLFIDTAPGMPISLPRLIAMADVVLVPVRPSPDDLVAAIAVAERLGRNVAWAFVMVQVPPRSKLAMGAVRHLAGIGLVAPVSLGFRSDYPTAAVTGTAAIEYAGTKAADEIKHLLSYVNTLRI